MFLFSLIALLVSLFLTSAAPMAYNGTNGENGTTVAGSHRNIAYFVNWAIYGRNYQPTEIPFDKLTHVLYAFANVRDTGEVYLSDTYSDLEKHYPGDSWNDVGTNAYGCTKQLYLLKKKNRALKTLLSIGGWTYSANFPTPASTDAGRANFAKTAVTLVKDMGFDGLDVDWEYPKDTKEADDMIALLKACREALDAYTAKSGGNHLLLTIASPAGPQNYRHMKLGQMAPYLDFLNLMAYDYAGSWDSTSGHQANLYPSADNPASTPFSTDACVKDYIAAGVPAGKIVLGMPLYGRAFEQTEGLGKPYSGVGEGSFERGIWDYKVLPQGGAVEQMDSKVGASWSWDAAAKKIVSYDNKAMSSAKVEYVKAKGLGGGMFWELSGDRKDNGSLVANVFSGLGDMDNSQNTLSYPDSKFDNIRNGMA